MEKISRYQVYNMISNTKGKCDIYIHTYIYLNVVDGTTLVLSGEIKFTKNMSYKKHILKCTSHYVELN